MQSSLIHIVEGYRFSDYLGNYETISRFERKHGQHSYFDQFVGNFDSLPDLKLKNLETSSQNILLFHMQSSIIYIL